MCLIKTLAFTDPLKVWGALGQLVSSMNHKQKSAQGFWKSFGFHDIGIIPSFYFSLNIFSYLKVQMGGLVGSREKRNLNKTRIKLRLFVTPWTVAHQAPLSMVFPRQEYWSGLPFLSPGDLVDPGIKPRSPALQADFLPSEPPGKPLKI